MVSVSFERVPGVAGSRVSNDVLLEAYQRLGNVWKVGDEVGMAGQTAHERLKRIGAINSPRFTEPEIERLKCEYVIYRDAGKLQELADAMGREKTSICAQARKLGLTDPQGAKPWLRTWKGITEDVARVIFEDFRKSNLNMTQYCTKKGIDDLGFSREMRRLFPAEWEAVIELKKSKQTRYRVGRALEYRVRDELKAAGYFALRSPQSRSPIDVLGIRFGIVLMVQCKRTGSMLPKEWNEVFDLAISCGAIPVLARTPTGRGTEYLRLTDRKDGSKRRQPMVAFDPARPDDAG